MNLSELNSDAINEDNSLPSTTESGGTLNSEAQNVYSLNEGAVATSSMVMTLTAPSPTIVAGNEGAWLIPPSPVIESIGFTGYVANFTLTSPLSILTGQMANSASGINVVTASPLLALDGLTGEVGTFNAASVIGAVTGFIPEGITGGDIQSPMLIGDGWVDVAWSMDAVHPVSKCTGTIVSGSVITGECLSPSAEGLGYFVDTWSFTAPSATVSGQIETGNTSTIELISTKHSLSASWVAEQLYELTLQPQRSIFTATLIPGANLAFQSSSRRGALSARGESGQVATASLAAPIPIVNVGLIPESIMSASL